MMFIVVVNLSYIAQTEQLIGFSDLSMELCDVPSLTESIFCILLFAITFFDC